jgi:hypothetical protein
MNAMLIDMAPSPPTSARSSLYIANSSSSSAITAADTHAAAAAQTSSTHTTVPLEIRRLVEAITDDAGSRLSEEGIFAEVWTVLRTVLRTVLPPIRTFMVMQRSCSSSWKAAVCDN